MLRVFSICFFLLLVALSVAAAPPDTAAAERPIWRLLRQSQRAIDRADYPAATRLAQQALRESRRLGSATRTELVGLRLLLGVAFSRSNAAEATGYARQALAVAQVLGDSVHLITAYDNLGNCLSEGGHYPEADKWLQLSRVGYQRLRDYGHESIALVNLAVNELYRHQLPPARTYAEAAVRAARRGGDSSDVSNTLMARARIRAEQGESTAAVADGEYALQLVRAGNSVEDIQYIRNGLPEVYELAGRPREALAAERRKTALNDSLNSRDVQRQLTELHTRFQVEQREARIRELSQAKRLAELRVWLLLGGLVVVVGGAAVFGRQYRRLRRTQRALAATTRTKDRLYSVVAHDLRSPIASFPGLLDLLRRYRDRAATHDFDGLLTEMRDASEQVARLLENLLQWAAGQHGELSVRPETLALGELLTEVAALYAPTAEAGGKRLSLALTADGAGLRALADRQMTRAIVRNLTDNALKYLPAGGTVRLWAETGAAGTVRLVVRDDGPGLTGAQLAAFNATAAPVGAAPTAEVRGTGLGLPLCRLLAERQGGNLYLTSAPGQGLTAVVELPAT